MKGSLAELLRRGLDENNDCERESLTPEERVNRLKKALEAYLVQHDFKVGDIVTGKRDCPAPYKDMGQPHIVVETTCVVRAVGDKGQNGEGENRNLRVGTMQDGDFNTYLVNPAYFEPYAG